MSLHICKQIENAVQTRILTIKENGVIKLQHDIVVYILDESEETNVNAYKMAKGKDVVMKHERIFK